MMFRSMPKVIGAQLQRGMVLLLALIVLVAMTLAGIGMLRSVDTATLIAGNLSFKQMAVHAGDVGIDDGYKWLLAVKAGNPNALTTNQSQNNCQAALNPAATGCQGGISNMSPAYWATVEACEVTNTCVGKPWWSDEGNWIAGKGVGVHVYPPDAVANQVTSVPPRKILVNDASGKLLATVYYLVHRMCDVNSNCQALGSGQVNMIGNSEIADAPRYNINSVLYRITARAETYRGAVSYTQAFVLVP